MAYEKIDRNRKIYLTWREYIQKEQRMSYDKLGAMFGLNGERIRQIIKREERRNYAN